VRFYRSFPTEAAQLMRSKSCDLYALAFNAEEVVLVWDIVLVGFSARCRLAPVISPARGWSPELSCGAAAATMHELSIFNQ
jgi:hypothetical protein